MKYLFNLYQYFNLIVPYMLPNINTTSVPSNFPMEKNKQSCDSPPPLIPWPFVLYPCTDMKL